MRGCIYKVIFLLTCLLASGVLKGQILSKDSLYSDFRCLTKFLEETHPDPYSEFGSKVKFHKNKNINYQLGGYIFSTSDEINNNQEQKRSNFVKQTAIGNARNLLSSTDNRAKMFWPHMMPEYKDYKNIISIRKQSYCGYLII